GSQMALYLLAGVLVDPGDRVAVEAFGYEPAWGAWLAHGATLSAIGVDGNGMDVDTLARRTPPRAVYLTPHHQYPTTVPLAADRRLKLLRWADEHRVALIEDDYDNEYHYDGQPLLPLAAGDRRGSVAYVGTLSKVVAPGLRIGWVVGPPNLLARIRALRSLVDAQGGLPVEAAVAELLEDGELQRHIWRTKRAYHERRDALAEALREHLGGALSFRVPAGGMALWADVDPSIDVDAWASAARARGVLVGTGQKFALDGKPCPHLRLGFARHEPAELREAIRTLTKALRPTKPAGSR
ncbi:MAG: PLP-dependent aminotransferase family protein, partial [Myxococcota bacterium]